ncbi:constitutive coactivator of PPAR-gamma-like protein 1 isoform X2 [Anneissia japonica]|uniref:constitutive coactivator of PPAR-gamma-like protein 1 isoform X2 n=1 Tax=Anneissia japonica TaxID=1529436 RepID=UPI001425A5B7|nr:constitutive coactivator of PPAR-gamma-like protein 1 isoform X2 [Anneissia japonica]
MGISGFLDYVERNCPQACERVDLGQVALKRLNTRRGRAPVGQNPLNLIVDADSCLHRLYGGSFTDWVCGGQWNSMFQFIDNLAKACRSHNIKLLVYFKGSLDTHHTHNWIKQQTQGRNTAYQALCHVHNKGTPPPKVWFVPPVALDTCIRLALRQCGIQTVSSFRDHKFEVINYLRYNGCQGVLAQSADFLIFDPPQVFSSHHLKLTRKGELLTLQYHINEILKVLDLHPERFVIFAALLGNHILPEEDLALFQWSLLGPDHPLNGLRARANQLVMPPCDVIVLNIANYVRSIPDIQDEDAIARDVFKANKTGIEQKINKFKACVKYYWSGTRDAWTHSRKNNYGRSNTAGGYPDTALHSESPHGQGVDLHGQSQYNCSQEASDLSQDLANLSIDAEKISPSCQSDTVSSKEEPKTNGDSESVGEDDSQSKPVDISKIPSLMSQPVAPCFSVSTPPLPHVAPEVLRIARHRHENAMLMPQVFQILSQGEIRLGYTLEDEMGPEFTPSALMFRPIRQKIYGLLFSIQQYYGINNREDFPRVVIKEWCVYQENTLQQPDAVEATPLEWVAPPISRMWLGRETEDKSYRLRAFLSCMSSDSPSMLKTAFVPRHAILLCCVLRYMMHFNPPILREHELDAFLSQSVSPILNQPKALQEMKISHITTRGIQLAAIFMRGIEAAMMANDACGSPIPWELCCPWLFFDGKLFQYKLSRAVNSSHLRDMCDGKMDQVGKVERMRQAIMEGIAYDFARARPTLPAHMGMDHMYPYPPMDYGMSFRPAGQMVPQGPGNKGRGRGSVYSRPMNGRGGRLEVAGMVVGEWAGSDGMRATRNGSGSGGGGGGRPYNSAGHQSWSMSPSHDPSFYFYGQGSQTMYGPPSFQDPMVHMQMISARGRWGGRTYPQGDRRPRQIKGNRGGNTGGKGRGVGRGVTIEMEDSQEVEDDESENVEVAVNSVENDTYDDAPELLKDESTTNKDAPAECNEYIDYGNSDKYGDGHMGGYDLPTATTDLSINGGDSYQITEQ